jgi:hypothetical protein
MTIEEAYKALCLQLAATDQGIEGQMFGKPCIKVGGKAAIAFHQEMIVFKLPSPVHEEAIAIEGARLWDPSGKGRAMKEWVQVPIAGQGKFETFAEAAAQYVSGQSLRTD